MYDVHKLTHTDTQMHTGYFDTKINLFFINIFKIDKKKNLIFVIKNFF